MNSEISIATRINRGVNRVQIHPKNGLFQRALLRSLPDRSFNRGFNERRTRPLSRVRHEQHLVSLPRHIRYSPSELQFLSAVCTSAWCQKRTPRALGHAHSLR